MDDGTPVRTDMKSIDLTPLKAVEVLPKGFLSDCRSLEGVDLTPLTNLREVGRWFYCPLRMQQS